MKKKNDNTVAVGGHPHPAYCSGVPVSWCPSVLVSQCPSHLGETEKRTRKGGTEKRTRKVGTEKRTIFGTDRHTDRQRFI